MYRDLIGDPEKIEVNGWEFWIQQFFHGDGTLKFVRLFDADGDCEGDFPSVEGAIDFAGGLRP